VFNRTHGTRWPSNKKQEEERGFNGEHVSAELEELADELDREAAGHDTAKLRKFAEHLDSLN
jgi:hypothetical protein